MISRFIESQATEILSELKIKSVPIQVEKIAKKLGLDVVQRDLGSNVSGVLYVQNGKGTIGYNPNESEVRKRFTIAHEIGHFVLHKINNDMFIDKKEFKLFRNEQSSTGEHRMEQEANAFAAALLMPKELLITEIKKFKIDLSDDEDDSIRNLAKKFEVSATAMTYRIDNLNLFTSKA
jgi:Zn-dependent peptidase ImmA (M78 family)